MLGVRWGVMPIIKQIALRSGVTFRDTATFVRTVMGGVNSTRSYEGFLGVGTVHITSFCHEWR